MVRLSKYAGVAALLVALGEGFSASAQKKPAARSGQSADSATREKIGRYIRERFPIPATTTVDVGPLRPSPFPDYYVTAIKLGQGNQQQSQDFYVSKDGRYLIQGSVYTLGADPRREVERAISTEDEPTVGPANAPVTIVEYADLQCPTCAQVEQFIEKDVLPKYRNTMRVVFKEFPLVNFHDWALAAAVASQCSYEIAPPAFVTYRSIIFKNQSRINAAHAREQLLAYAEQAGIDRSKFTACVDSQNTMPRVEKDFHEGQALGVSSTPTFFVNGKMLVGAPAAEEFYKAVDAALQRTAGRKQ